MSIEHFNIRDNTWFFIENYVQIFNNKKNILFYNTLNGDYLEFPIENNYSNHLIKKIISKKELRTILIHNDFLRSNSIIEFFEQLRNKFMGDFLVFDETKNKPFQLVPSVKIEQNIKTLKKDPYRSEGEKIGSYLNEVSFFLNNTCDLDCNFCENGFKQTLLCTKTGSYEKHFDIELLLHILESSLSYINLRINFVGGNILKYSNIHDLAKYLKTKRNQNNFYIHYLNVINELSKIDQIISENSVIYLIFSKPLIFSKINGLSNYFSKKGISFKLLFVVQDEDDLEEIKHIISKLNIQNYILKPYFNGKNLEFFQKFVFLSKTSILAKKITMNEIYIREKINNVFFGKLSFFPDLRVFSSLNKKEIGNLEYDKLYDVIYNEMTKGKSWFLVRNHVNPCKGCNYKFLCPPISNYELFFKKYNLCDILN